MKKSFSAFIAVVVLRGTLLSQAWIADHEIAREDIIREIPASYIVTVRNELHIAYQHTSHGTHVSYGMYGLPGYREGDDTLFAIYTSVQAGKLEFRDNVLSGYAPAGVVASDLSVNEKAFIQTTRNYLDAPGNVGINVVMWSWCDIAGHDVAGIYLPGMDSLIAEYGPGGTKIGSGPGQRETPVTFIFMTGHANANANLGAGRPRDQAQLIIDHCNTHGYYCLDYYSIDTHDMDGNYWEDTGDDGNSAAYGGNFYVDWQNSHVLGEDFYENQSTPGGSVTFGAHNTQHITANRKAYAMWWILARIAGWDGNFFVPVSQMNVSSQGGVTEVLTGSTVQFSATVLPANATDKTVTWSVANQTGSATISQAGLLTAVAPGTVNVVATAHDGFGVTGSLQITIENPVVPVSQVSVSSQGGVTEVLTGSTLQFSATVLPANATDKTVTWSVANQTGSATISQAGLLTAVAPGTVDVIAAAGDGSGVSGSMEVNILENTTSDFQGTGHSLTLYPNPGEGIYMLDAGEETVVRIMIYDLKGSLVRAVHPSSAGPTVLDLTGQAPGSYLVEIVTGSGHHSKRVIIR